MGTVLPLILIGRDESKAPSLAAVRSIGKLRELSQFYHMPN